MATKRAAIILAAGQSKRMKSNVPKVLHHIAGRSVLEHVVGVALSRRYDSIVVVVSPNHSESIQNVLHSAFPNAPLIFASQKQARGTGDATRVGLDALKKFRGVVTVLCGDAPLLRSNSLAQLEQAVRGVSLSLLTARLADPAAYGRIVRDGKWVRQIVEFKDATAQQKEVSEINAGIYCFDSEILRQGLKKLQPNNAQKEYYLTDVVSFGSEKKGAVAVSVEDPSEILGINTRAELAQASALMRDRLVEKHQQGGVTFIDPKQVYLSDAVQIGSDCVVGPNVQLWGSTIVETGTHIEGSTVLRDAQIGKDVVIRSFCHIEGATVGDRSVVGPFARLRPGAELGQEVHIGNFVEVKKSRLQNKVKANHLAYLGDATIGEASNIGAGTITCNYDGIHKHPTTIGKGVFVGSNSTLVAPLTIHEGAYIAAGSTVTKEVPKESLAFGRARQSNLEGYATRLRNKKKVSSRTGD